MVPIARLSRVLAFSALALIAVPAALEAQQAETPATEEIAAAVAPAPAPAVKPAPPAPQSSPLFEASSREASTLAAAERAHEAENRQGRHVISMSTLTLVLVIVILVLLID